VNVDEVWRDGDLYIQDDGRLVRVLDRGDGTHDVVIREPDGTPVTSMNISDSSLTKRIAEGRWQ